MILTTTIFYYLYNYYVFFAPELHQDADALIEWLTTTAYRKPAYYPHGESPVFHTNGNKPKVQIINYRCSRCKKGFSPLTGTLLARSRRILLWQRKLSRYLRVFMVVQQKKMLY
ncbi:hypothetical protein B7R74_18775 [Yersinia pseudotuberculosis]|nr:hypothetical protein B7R74_18775 [Yersinia pseudotuberculosis]